MYKITGANFARFTLVTKKDKRACFRTEAKKYMGFSRWCMAFRTT